MDLLGHLLVANLLLVNLVLHQYQAALLHHQVRLRDLPGR